VFKGSLIALATPFDADNRVDYGALEELIEFHIKEGSDGLVIAGTTGEAATLEKSEHVELIAKAVDIVNGRLSVIAGTGSNSTAQTIKLSREVGDFGIDAYLMVVPYYNKPMQEGMYRHFSTIADAVDKPVMLYNVPGRTVADMLPETIARLATHPNIFGIKEATGDMERLRQIQELVDESFMLYSGDDFTALEFMESGGHGVVSVCGNVAPRLSSDMCRAALAGDSATAKKLDDRLQPLNKALFVESNPIPVKWALAEMGLISPGIRLPLTSYSEAYHDEMRLAMRNAGIEL
jgi:4-hydroxy-tetrahydrodipicolinate synthase